MSSPLPRDLELLFAEVDRNKARYIDNLRDAIAIRSVSMWADTRPDTHAMMHWAAARLEAIGATVELVDVGKQPMLDGTELSLPNVLLGQLGNDPAKTTVCVYGHLDVQPARRQDGWHTDPFVLTEKDGKLFGRGASDDKGPVLAWLHAIEAYQTLQIPVPVNVKFVLECMEEVNSDGLQSLLEQRKNTFLKGTDYVCVSDNFWLGTEKPCITYGLRGICCFQVEIECAALDLHSGVFGGTVHEAMTDLVWMLNQLVDSNGRILIDGLYDEVPPVSANERQLYDNISFDVPAYKAAIGAKRLLYDEDKSELLMHCWRYPSLSIHGIEGDFSELGLKTVIPRKVKGKFSIRTVRNQEAEQIGRYVREYLSAKWAERGSANGFHVQMLCSDKPWSEDPDHPNYMAARKATKHVYQVEPDLTRAGGSNPMMLVLQQVTGRNVVMVPLGSSDDGAHSQNEKINVRNYIEGTKLLGAYLYEVAQLPTVEK